ncbi:MAG: hypothetical protein ACXWIU_13595 [Limisphaerales bacterium]
MRWIAHALFLVTPALLCSFGCAAIRNQPESHNQPTTVTNATPAQGVLQNGYALLFDLLGDEKNVSLLHFIKSEQPELKTLMSDISRVSGEAYKRLEEFGQADPYLNLKNEGLPLAELAARKSISTMKTRLLLHGKGPEFELQLLLSQNEALVYGANLAQVTAASETDSQRALYLRETADRLLQLDNRVVQMLLHTHETPRTGLR